jgi:thymidylate kinase
MISALEANHPSPLRLSPSETASAALPFPPVSPPEAADRRGEILAAIFRVLDDAGVRYCVPHGHEFLPAQVHSDVDLIVEQAALPNRLAELLEAHASAIGAQVIQWLDDRAHFIVLADTRQSGSPQLLQLHITPDFEQANRIFYTGPEMLDSRFNRNGVFLPAAEIEFGCILCNRIAKGKLGDDRIRRLAALHAQSPLACEQQITRFFSASSAIMLCLAAQSRDWTAVKGTLAKLQTELLANTADTAGMVRRRIGAWARRIKRWVKPPCGLHVVFLGPDGVGKSTVIAAVQEDLSAAFLKTEYHTFAPSLLPARMQQKPSPHALPPRGKLASLYKAGWWLVCYTLGYLVSIHPARARSAFVLNHRYLLDAIVDPKRYRYSGPKVLLKLIAVVAPKPDLVVLLSAPAEVIQSRKQEVPFEETARQCREYRELVERLPNGRIIDASVAPQETIAAVEGAILQLLRQRIVCHFGFGIERAEIQPG